MRAENPPHIKSLVSYEFSGRGEIYSHTTTYEEKYIPIKFAKQIPLTLAIVRLEEGPLTTAQLTDLGDQKPVIGMPVEMVTRFLMVEGDPDRGLRIYGPKFRPLFTNKA